MSIMSLLGLEGNFDVDQWVLDHWIRTPEDIVFVSGSRIEGFGNPTSDIDIFVITRRDDYTGFRAPEVAVLGELECDCEIYSRDWIQELADRLNRVATTDYDTVYRISHPELDLYYRAAVGQPTFNEERFRSFQQRFSKDTVANLVNIWAGLRCGSELRTAQELLRTNDYAATFQRTREAISWAVDSYLAVHGEAFPARKWRFEKLKRRFGESSDVYRKAWALKSLGARKVEDYVREGAEFCTELGMECFYRWRFDNPKLRRVSNAEFFPIADEYYVIHNKTFLYQVDLMTRYLWEQLDGATPENRLIANLAAEFGIEVAESERYCREALRALSTNGLIEG